MAEPTRLESYPRQLQQMTDADLAAEAATICLGCLRSWGDLRDQYRLDVNNCCLEFEKRGQRARWDGITEQARRIRREELRIKA